MLVSQIVRHGFAGLVVLRIMGEDLRLAGPMFVDLRRKFDEIARRIGA